MYNSKYTIFDAKQIKTYPISTRINKVKINDIVKPEDALKSNYEVNSDIANTINSVAKQIIQFRKENKPVILFTGAHSIKNGLGRLWGDLVERGLLTLIAGNGATSIHDFELALIGQTSEYVPDALEKGQFGMAYEFCYHNYALHLGSKYNLGYGESLGKMICDPSFRSEAIKFAKLKENSIEFKHPELSLLAECYKKNIPFTIHVGIGTDVVDQHSSFDGRVKGACSGRDFLIYTNEVTKLIDGGVILNVGSAVIGPEVFLKAASMAGNIGKIPNKIISADFDLRTYDPQQMANDAAQCYYFRDQKSVVTRIPQAFGGKGYYIQGNQKITIPLLYKTIIEML
jgi:hypothetical protein